MNKRFEGFKPPNTTPVPDIVFDELLVELTGNELKVLLYIVRRTYGFGKNADAISLSQFRKGITTKEEKVLDKGCGLEHNRTILVALASLEKKGYVISKKRQNNAGDSDTTIYKLHFQEAPKAQASEEVVTSGNQVVTSGNDGSYPTSPRWLPQVTTVVTSGNPQETVIQDTDSQETVIQEGTNVTSAIAESDAPAPIDFKTESAKLKAISLQIVTDYEEALVIPPRLTLQQKEQTSSTLDSGTPVQHSGASPEPSLPFRAGAAQEEEKPPMALTAKQIKAQADKRADELWTIIEEERKTTYTANQRKEHKDGIALLIADDISDEVIRTGLQKLSPFERRTFTVFKFYGWLPNLCAKEPTQSRHQEKDGPVLGQYYLLGEAM